MPMKEKRKSKFASAPQEDLGSIKNSAEDGRGSNTGKIIEKNPERQD